MPIANSTIPHEAYPAASVAVSLECLDVVIGLSSTLNTQPPIEMAGHAVYQAVVRRKQ